MTDMQPSAGSTTVTEPTKAHERRPLITHRAVLADGPDSAVPAHYGAPLREQRALLRGKAVVDMGQLEVLEIAGEDRASWLTTVTSQVFTSLAPGASIEVTVLSPQGRVEHWAQVVTLESSFLFIFDVGARAGARAYFQMMTFASRIELRDRDELRVLGSVADPREVLASVSPLAVFAQAWPRVTDGGLAYGPDPDFPEPWHLGIYEASQLVAAVGRGELTRDMVAGMSSAEAVRVLNHRPRFATEVDERSIPHELDLLRTAVHTNKGCYRGQETVAKVMNLGQPPRRLVRLHVDGSQDVPVPRGSEVLLGSKVVGSVTTSAMHADEGPVALAVIRRAVPLDAALTVRVVVGGDAEQVVDVDASQVPIVVPREHAARPETASLQRRPGTHL